MYVLKHFLFLFPQLQQYKLGRAPASGDREENKLKENGMPEDKSVTDAPHPISSIKVISALIAIKIKLSLIVIAYFSCKHSPFISLTNVSGDTWGSYIQEKKFDGER